MQDHEIQEQLNHIWSGWQLGELLGEGAYGKVFRIERDEFGHIYESALKVISIPQNQSELQSVLAEGMDLDSAATYFYGIVRDIVEEFTLMSSLRGNTNIVSYEDHAVVPVEGTIGWNIFIRMELLTPMLDYLQTHKATKREILKLGVDMCQALEICRDCDIIHRDIKPENIFVSKMGKYKLGDFGIARKMEKTTGNLSRKGTLNYMAPEVFNGIPYGETVDSYSLGLVLYRMLNQNRMPFLPPYPQQLHYSDKEEANEKRMSGAPMPPPCNAKGRLAEIVLKACAFRPEDRYSDVSQMKEELLELLRAEEKKNSERTAGQTAHAAGFQQTVTPEPVAQKAGQPGYGAQSTSYGTGSSGYGTQSTQGSPYGTGQSDYGTQGAQGSSYGMGQPDPGTHSSQGGWKEPDDTAAGMQGNRDRTPPDAGETQDNSSLRGKYAGPDNRSFQVGPYIAAGILVVFVLGFCISRGLSKNKVPDLTGQTLTEAVDMAWSGRSRLIVQSSGEAFSDTVERGKIISQNVEPGTSVKKGETITVVVSKGKAATVPDLTGKTREEAKSLTEAAGLVYSELNETFSDLVPAGSVISQEEAAGTVLSQGTKLAVVVSLGNEYVEVPDLVGKTVHEMELALQAVGLSCNAEMEYSSKVEQGRVIRQDVEAGKKLIPGSMINIVVSQGPDPAKAKKKSGSSKK